MGIEDPERYVVGSDENSIHPETGAYEFFFKKIFSGIKKIFKTIVKVVKKLAPIVLPIALGMTGLGAIYGAALGSGIGTLINGGSLKDALKSGVMAGITGGIIKGVSGPGSFMQNVGAELAAPGARLTQFGQGLSNTAKNIIPGGATGVQGGPGLFDKFAPSADLLAKDTFSGRALSAVQPEALANASSLSDAARADAAKTLGETGAFETKGFAESIQGGDFKGALLPRSQVPTIAEVMANNAGMGIKEATAYVASATPNMLQSYLPAAVAGTGALALAGGFTAAPQEDPGLIDKDEDGNVITGSDLIAADPGKYLVKDLGQVTLNEETGEYETKSMYQPSEMASYNTSVTDMMTRNPFESGIGSVSTATGPFARPSIVQNLSLIHI